MIPLKILVGSNESVSSMTGGGVGTHYLIEKFVEKRHYVTVSTPLYADPDEVSKHFGSRVRIRPFTPFYVSKNAKFRGPRYILYGAMFTPHLYHLLKTHDFDLVLVRNCIVGSSGAFVKRVSKIPFVISLTDLLSAFLYEQLVPPYYPRLLADIFLYFERGIPRAYDKVFVVSDMMKRELVGGGVPEERIVVSYDGVDTRLFDPAKTNPRGIREKYGIGENPVVLFHGTLEAHHGPSEIVKVVAEASVRMENIVFLIVGTGPAYQYLHSVLGKRRNVIMTGHVPHEEIPEYLASADVGFLPYPKDYGTDMILTLKMLEYLAMGKPVVSTNLTSIEETFGGCGFVRTARNAEEFAREILRFTSLGEDERKRLGGEARKVIEQRFSWDIVTECIVDACSELVDRGS